MKNRMKRAQVVSIGRLMSGSLRLTWNGPEAGFAWRTDRLVQLLADLDAIADDRLSDARLPDGCLYMGVITTTLPHKGQARILDGGQRLTALLMLIACARDRLGGGRLCRRLARALARQPLFGPGEARLRMSGAAGQWFAGHILSPGATLRLPGDAPDATTGAMLLNARLIGGALDAMGAAGAARISRALLDNTSLVRSLSAPDAWQAGADSQSPGRDAETFLRVAAE
jgi:hypothetical protein